MANSMRLLLALCCLGCLCLQGYAAQWGAALRTHSLIAPKQQQAVDKVLLELYVMSRCPDALFAEAKLDEVLGVVHELVEVQLHYIASAYGPEVACRHGPMECDGNKQQLCVAQYTDSYDGLWRFVQCQDKHSKDIGSMELAEKCLAKLPDAAAADMARSCMTGWEGDGLLRGDAARTQAMGIQRSCTIVLEGQTRCVRDGGAWVDCAGGHSVDDFIDSICTAYENKTGSWPRLCGKKKHTDVAHTATR